MSARVLVCDDHPVFRDGMRLLLEELGYQVVAEAATGEHAVELAAELHPDVVVMDLHLAGQPNAGQLSGVEATRRITTADPGVGVLVVTLLDDDAALFAALRAGARGYLLKGASHADVQHALDGVARGDTVLSGTVGERLRRGLVSVRAARPFPQLTDREFEILELMCRGRSNDQIARGLVLSPKTIRNNVSIVLTKLGAGNRAEAVARGRDAGIGNAGGVEDGAAVAPGSAQ